MTLFHDDRSNARKKYRTKRWDRRKILGKKRLCKNESHNHDNTILPHDLLQFKNYLVYYADDNDSVQCMTGRRLAPFAKNRIEKVCQ